MGDSRIMNPLMMGLEFRNKFRIPYNGMRVIPAVVTSDIDYSRVKNAYPQEKIQ
jgi:hypothetical protein